MTITWRKHLQHSLQHLKPWLVTKSIESQCFCYKHWPFFCSWTFMMWYHADAWKQGNKHFLFHLTDVTKNQQFNTMWVSIYLTRLLNTDSVLVTAVSDWNRVQDTTEWSWKQKPFKFFQVNPWVLLKHVKERVRLWGSSQWRTPSESDIFLWRLTHGELGRSGRRWWGWGRKYHLGILGKQEGAGHWGGSVCAEWR